MPRKQTREASWPFFNLQEALDRSCVGLHSGTAQGRQGDIAIQQNTDQVLYEILKKPI